MSRYNRLCRDRREAWPLEVSAIQILYRGGAPALCRDTAAIRRRRRHDTTQEVPRYGAGGARHCRGGLDTARGDKARDIVRDTACDTASACCDTACDTTVTCCDTAGGGP